MHASCPRLFDRETRCSSATSVSRLRSRRSIRGPRRSRSSPRRSFFPTLTRSSSVLAGRARNSTGHGATAWRSASRWARAPPCCSGPGSAASRSRASSLTSRPTFPPIRESRCCCRSTAGASRSISGRIRATGAGPCTRATTASRGPGFSRARCSPWWRGATRSTSREAGGVFRARRVCARAPVSISADGVRSDAALLRALLSALAARARRHGRRLARRGGELPPGALGGGAAETRRAADREGGTVERRGIPARAVLDDRARHLLADPRLRVRVLAPLDKYPLPRYLGAVALGRYLRLLLVASSGALLRIPLPLLVLASVGIVLAGLGWRRLQRAGLTEP